MRWRNFVVTPRQRLGGVLGASSGGVIAILVVVGLMLSASARPAFAQFPGMGGNGQPSRDSAGIAVSPVSPRAAVESFLRHARADQWDQAADYLSVPPAERDRSRQIAKRLQIVLDQRLALDLQEISPLAVGDTLDGERLSDQIGVIAGVAGREDPVRLVRVTSRQPTRWLFSQATVAQVDGWYENLGAPWLRERLPAPLMREGPLRLFLWQWIGLALALPLLVLVAWLTGELTRWLLSRVATRTDTDWDDLLIVHLRGPFRLWVGAVAAPWILNALDLNARVAALIETTSRSLVLLAIFWALLRVIRLAQLRVENRAWETGQGAQARTLAPLFGNILRVTVGVAALLVALSQFGYPVGTLLAGLGIGGIAVALAAQKTVEHLFGSVSLAADKAFRVGDWVRAGATEGAVERIGLRSTSIRTHDRTVVRIPNGRLADERIETFGERDRMYLRTDVDLTYDTPPEVIAAVCDALERTLRAEPTIWPDQVRAHVVEFTESAVRVRVMAWFVVTDLMEFFAIRHRLLLEFMRIVDRHGSSFAFPSRTIYHVPQDSSPRDADSTPYAAIDGPSTATADGAA